MMHPVPPPAIQTFSALVPLLLSERIRSVLISRPDTTGGWFVPDGAVGGRRDHLVNPHHQAGAEFARRPVS
jgi:hypothetical protein